jgi:hypothetical protein
VTEQDIAQCHSDITAYDIRYTSKSYLRLIGISIWLNIHPYTVIQPEKKRNNPQLILSSLASAATPAPALAFLLDMHNEVHAAALEELDCALADVLDVCGVRGDDVDHAEDPLLAGCVAVVVVVVVVVDVVVA